MNPDEGEILLNYGAFLIENGRPEEAIAPLEHALEDLDYRSPAMVLSNLARAELATGHPEKAKARAEAALKRAPNLCPAQYHLGLAEEALAALAVVLTRTWSSQFILFLVPTGMLAGFAVGAAYSVVLGLAAGICWREDHPELAARG